MWKLNVTVGLANLVTSMVDPLLSTEGKFTSGSGTYSRGAAMRKVNWILDLSPILL